ncbi:MAG: hypothetical protein KA712_24290 [Myxococcales bacterium]|nr:hypothetical protein [Myxococcales bacterium]
MGLSAALRRALDLKNAPSAPFIELSCGTGDTLIRVCAQGACVNTKTHPVKQPADASWLAVVVEPTLERLRRKARPQNQSTAITQDVGNEPRAPLAPVVEPLRDDQPMARGPEAETSPPPLRPPPDTSTGARAPLSTAPALIPIAPRPSSTPAVKAPAARASTILPTKPPRRTLSLGGGLENALRDTWAWSTHLRTTWNFGSWESALSTAYVHAFRRTSTGELSLDGVRLAPYLGLGTSPRPAWRLDLGVAPRVTWIHLEGHRRNQGANVGDEEDASALVIETQLEGGARYCLTKVRGLCLSARTALARTHKAIDARRAGTSVLTSNRMFWGIHLGIGIAF